MIILRALFIFLASVFLLAASAGAEEPSENVMLVLDASGSMWGQVDGTPKISVARDVVSGMLDDWDVSRHLGLIAYGHRRKGDCKDIETLADVGPLDLNQMKSLVIGLSPRGKTPITASVLKAAEALKFREEKATVILISDGLETCKADPCALARELETAGIDFTVHVVGFDLAKKDTSSLQCLADETGGQYLSAANAGELKIALKTVSAPPAPSKPARYSFRATEAKNGPVISSGLAWVLSPAKGGPPIFSGSPGGVVRADILPGEYLVEVFRPSDEANAEKTFRVTSGLQNTITLVLPAFAPPASVSGPSEAPAGSIVEFTWDGPNDKNDFLSVAKPGAKPGKYLSYAYTRKGSPLELRLSDEPGPYEVRYIHNGSNKKNLATALITATPVEASLDAADTSIAGKMLEVIWSGPEYKNDYIAIAKPKAKKGQYESYSYTRKGSPLEVRVPEAPGTYEVRYILGQSKNVLARRTLIVEQAEVEITAPEKAPLGSPVEVTWTGPDNQNDYITIVNPKAKQGKYGNYTYTREGSPLEVRAPEEPGEYEIRYVAGQKKSILARRPLIVEDVDVSLFASENVPLGSMVEITWGGPNNKNDYITIVNPQAKQGKYGNYTYTREGSPLEVRAPEEPGGYEIRYVAGQKKSILARRDLIVEDVEVSLTAQDNVTLGASVEVTWVGPNNKNDYITIVKPEAKQGKYGNYTYTREGSPLEVRAPEKPGEYEIRYVAGQKKYILASRPLVVEKAGISLAVPDDAAAGSVLEVDWEGPNNKNDFLTIVKLETKQGKYGPYTYTREGSPLELKIPDEPGEYEIRYLSGAKKLTLLAVPIVVTEVTATLQAADRAPAGTLLDIAWTGPNNKNDFITVVAKGTKETKYAKYTYTRKGSPLEMKLPKEPGEYEIRYLMGQSKRTLARLPLLVE